MSCIRPQRPDSPKQRGPAFWSPKGGQRGTRPNLRSHVRRSDVDCPKVDVPYSTRPPGPLWRDTFGPLGGRPAALVDHPAPRSQDVLKSVGRGSVMTGGRSDNSSQRLQFLPLWWTDALPTPPAPEQEGRGFPVCQAPSRRHHVRALEWEVTYDLRISTARAIAS